MDEKSVRLDEKSVRLEEKSNELKEKSKILEDKSVILERSNTETVQEINRIKESIESQLVIGATNDISQVGFTAVLTKDIKPGQRQAMQYDKVIINIGAGYDLSHEHFKTPVSGLYIISATSCSCENEKIWREIVVNGIKQAAMYGNTYDMGSHTIVVSLKQNDQVWVRNFGKPTTVHAGHDRYYSSFSGVLITAS